MRWGSSPWPSGWPSPSRGPASDAPSTLRCRSRRRQSAAAVAVTPSLPPTALKLANEECYFGTEWRVFTVEETTAQLVHTWYPIDPVQASGPTDQAIPFLAIYRNDLGELGYCAITVPGGPRPILSTEAWVMPPGSPPESIPLVHLSRYAPSDPNVGVLYAPPPLDGTQEVAWKPGRYVFVVRYGTKPADENWFGVDIVNASGP